MIDGFRPLAHLRRITAAGAFDDVCAQLRRPTARHGHIPATGRAASGNPAAGSAAARQARPTGRIRVRHVQIGQPRRDVIEAVAVLTRAGRAWALAVRLEFRDGTWLCTHLDVV